MNTTAVTNLRSSQTVVRALALVLLCALASSVQGQAPATQTQRLNKVSVEAVEDMGKIKLLAERDNMNAQVKLAEICMERRYYADALKWYSAAAAQGHKDALYQKGHLLLFGCERPAAGQQITVSPSEGLQLTYEIATNGNVGACFDIGQALKDGLGCPADAVAAYAWFSFCSEAGCAASKKNLNDLALPLSTEDIRKALTLARKMKGGNWPALPTAPAAPTSAPGMMQDIELKLSGVSQSRHGALAIINNKTLGEGETVGLMNEKKALVNVTCLHVNQDTVEVQIEGETYPRTVNIFTMDYLTTSGTQR